MSNNAYLRSRRREQELVNKYRSEGWVACRSAGSKSPWDVWAYHPTLRKFEVVQIKTKKGGRGVYTKVLWKDMYDVTALWIDYE